MEYKNFINMSEVSTDFQKGVELFRRKHRLEPKYPEARKLIDESGEELILGKPVKALWYKKLITAEEKKNSDERVLSTEGIGKHKMYWVAFLAVNPPAGCLETANPYLEEKITDEINVGQMKF